MSTVIPTSGFKYPEYKPSAPRAKEKWYVNAASTVSSCFVGLMPLYIALLVIGAAVIGLLKATAGGAPAWLEISFAVFGMSLTAILVLTVVIRGAIVAVLGTPVMVQMWRERKYPVDLDHGYAANIVASLKALGMKNARDVVGNSPLNAEAYCRVRGNTARLAMAQGMSSDEAYHHGHNFGLLMYPGTEALALEAPLMRVLEDRGVTNANDARDALKEPQYAVFASPVSDEEVAASLKPADPSKASGNYETVFNLEEKIAQGYKPTIGEREMIKATNNSLERLGWEIAMVPVIFIGVIGLVLSVGLAVALGVAGASLPITLGIGVGGILATIGAVSFAD